ncbi:MULTISPECIES: hypothetical protein [Pseudomonas]|uniref:Uncharacterized protein n=1 Tax=Pseudomonas quercus TaxID=2722792 RepID=A0ABX0YI21_9PSED|nr:MULTISPECIES: hypothetical protein [Pseudomonas]MBF7144511.1 hypothetical protein [Pseudomonas sp. LY10J]NJP03050.1 hypothetical protein [Pseudomonas quercus]
MPNKLLLGNRPIRIGSIDPPPGDDGNWIKRTLAVALEPTGASSRIDTPPEHTGITCKGDEWHEYPANRLPDEEGAPLNPSHMRVLISASGHLKFIAERQADKGVNAHGQEALVSLIHAPTLTNLPNKVLATIVGYAAPNTVKDLKSDKSASVPRPLSTLGEVNKRLQQAAVSTMSTKQNFYLGAGPTLSKYAGVTREHLKALAARDPIQQRLVYFNFVKLTQLGLSHADIVNASGLNEAGLNALLKHGPMLKHLGFEGADIVAVADKPERLAFFAHHEEALKSLALPVRMLDRIAGAAEATPQSVGALAANAFATSMAEQILNSSTNFGKGAQTQPIKDLIADVLQKLSVSDAAHRDAAIDIMVSALSRRAFDLSPSHIADSIGYQPAVRDSVGAYALQLAGMRSAPKSNTSPTGPQAPWPTDTVAPSYAAILEKLGVKDIDMDAMAEHPEQMKFLAEHTQPLEKLHLPAEVLTRLAAAPESPSAPAPKGLGENPLNESAAKAVTTALIERTYDMHTQAMKAFIGVFLRKLAVADPARRDTAITAISAALVQRMDHLNSIIALERIEHSRSTPSDQHDAAQRGHTTFRLKELQAFHDELQASLGT